MRARSVLVAAGVLALLVLTLFFGRALIERSYQYQGSLFEPALEAYTIQLRDHNENLFDLSAQRGKLVLLFFGYANCPDVCPTTLSDFKQIYDGLGDRAEEVEFVFVTIDPERDSFERIGQYVTAFNPTFIGLSGSLEELQPVWDGYFVYRQKQESDSEAGYLMDHTSRVYVVDREGLLRLSFPFGMGAEAMTQDIEFLLRQ